MEDKYEQIQKIYKKFNEIFTIAKQHNSLVDF